MAKGLCTYFLTRWIFIRLLGIIYLIAFVSMGSQVLGLIGSEGILPAKSFLQSVEAHYGPNRFWVAPTLFWLDASNPALIAVCGLGAVLSFFLIVGLAPRLMLLLLWAFYLSLVVVGQEFLSFQWDALLLEAGFLSIFFAEHQFLPRLVSPIAPSSIALWLLRLLLFKVMFSSGIVKILSGDPTWANFTALSYHYMTQPLPTVIAWYFDQLPLWFHKVSAFFMFAIELVLPFFIFFGWRMRLIAFFGLTGLQIFILLTGNYCFFNLLTIGLCLTLLDDETLKPFFRKSFVKKYEPHMGVLPRMDFTDQTLAFLAAAFVFLMTFAPWIPLNVDNKSVVKSIHTTARLAAGFRTVNNYGLFAVMTTKRREIIFEGSLNGQEWKTYEFRWKPGRLDRAPGWVQPHQPRLDWQMWFAALSPYERNPWVLNCMRHLLQNSPAVVGLLQSNPFKEAPPRYLRARFYEYGFTDFKTRKETGHWWRRQELGLYCPVLSATKE